ncbi:MAG: CorA family divalent cation transporter [Candidatus Nanopelagicales bacterium]
MEVRIIDAARADVVPVGRLTSVLSDAETLVWVDVPHCDEEAIEALREAFGFHPVAIRECVERQRMPKFHAYADHFFAVLHSPERGQHGHVHYVEIDQFIGAGYLVTVHGPTNPAVPADVPLQDTSAVWARIASGGFHPQTPVEISHAVITAMALRMEETIESVTADVWSLEQRVIGGQLGDPEAFLDEMFRTRHALLAVANVTGNDLEVQEQMASADRGIGDRDRACLNDSVDLLRRANRLAGSQREYLEGVIEFYRTRTDTRTEIAAERLAVIAVVTLPITALASVLGMNVIVNDRTQLPWLILSLMIMLTMSAYLLKWAREHGWW